MVVDDGAGRAGGESGAFDVEEQRAGGFGAGPVGSFLEPQVELGSEFGVDRHGAGFLTLAVDA
jgi:hypothetical protein